MNQWEMLPKGPELVPEVVEVNGMSLRKERLPGVILDADKVWAIEDVPSLPDHSNRQIRLFKAHEEFFIITSHFLQSRSSKEDGGFRKVVGEEERVLARILV